MMCTLATTNIERNQDGVCGKILERKIEEGNLTEAQLIGVFAEDFHDSFLLNEFIKSFATLSNGTSKIDEKKLSVENRVDEKVVDADEAFGNLSEAELFGVFAEDFHDSTLINKFMKAITSLSAENTVLFSLADNRSYEEEEHLYYYLADYRQTEYLYPRIRLSAGQVVIKKLTSFGRAIRRAFRLKNIRKIFRMKKSSTIIVDNI